MAEIIQIDEKLFSKIASEVEDDWGMYGLSSTMYEEYAKEVTLRYIKQASRCGHPNPKWKCDFELGGKVCVLLI